jgi:hypothetical protein
MRLRLYVEDAYFEPYEILARKWLLALGQTSVDVKAVRLPLNKMADDMPDFVRKAWQDGYACVVFVIDQEAADARERQSLLEKIRKAYEDLCQFLPDSRELKDMRLGLVVAQRCLESWLLTDMTAVKAATLGVTKNVDYKPDQRGDTSHLAPQDAVKEITHVWRVVTQKAGKGAISRVKYRKSNATDIASHFTDLRGAVTRNKSLHHFCETIRCNHAGCAEPLDF